MTGSRKGSWWGLYALIPVAAVLLYGAARVRVGETLRSILFIAAATVIAGLAWRWSERHVDLMTSEGANARAEEESLAAMGVRIGRFAPSLTPRQAHYRSIMLMGRAGHPQAPAATRDHSM